MITFVIDSTLIPTGESAESLQARRNGVPVSDCMLGAAGNPVLPLTPTTGNLAGECVAKHESLTGADGGLAV